MATINWPKAQGGANPRGYHYDISDVGSDAVSTVVGVPTDAMQFGMQVVVTSGTYFVEGTMNDRDAVVADTAVWYDLLGNGTDAQTVSKQMGLELGVLTAIRLRSLEEEHSLAASVEMRR